MALRFIIGRAGTGKTRACLEEIANALRESPTGKPLIFLVPEQATFQTELALCSMPGIRGLLRAHVLSFRRLAHHVLHAVGGGAKPRVGDLGKQMLLRRLLDTRRSELHTLNRVPAVPGFLQILVSAMSEFKTYLVTPAILADTAGRIRRAGEPRLGGKTSDLALLYADLEKHLAGHHTDPDDYLNLLAEKIPHSALVGGATIWMDGFSGFTPQEYKVLEALLLHAPRVSVALCLDAPEDRAAPNDVFHVTRLTHRKLSDMAARLGVPIDPPLVLAADPPPRFAAAPALARVEQGFCGFANRPFPSEPAAIRLVAAADRQAEVEAVAREIIHLCRDRGYRFREISIVARQLELYRDYIREIFPDFSIPFFVDSKRTVTHHPVIELIRSALDTVISGWAYDPVFRYLKTDLVPVDRASVDQLENYVLEFGLYGSRWTDGSPWMFRAERLEARAREPSAAQQSYLREINSIRDRAVAALALFEAELDGVTDVSGITRCLVQLLLRLDVPGRLEAWSDKAREQGDPDLALEYAQLWNGLMDLFDELAESLGPETFSLSEYARVLEAGLDGLRLALIPPALDQVLVSSLERSRNPNVRAAFVIGVNEGIFPVRQRDTGLFSDRERDRLAADGLELAPGMRQRRLQEQFLVYIGLTRSSEYLWVSYAAADEDGAALNPSSIIEHLRAIFPRLREKVFAAEPGHAPGTDLHYVARPERILPYLAVQLRAHLRGGEINPVWWGVYDYVRRVPGAFVNAETVLGSLTFRNADPPLHPAQTLQLYGNPLYTSVSRIELMNACPFAHFCSYGLRLRERRVYAVGPPDVGQFLHAALKVFVERITTQARDWSELDDDECLELATAVVDELTPALQNEILLSTERHRHLGRKVRQTVGRAALVLTEHARRGRFRPVGVEVPFGPGARIAPPPLMIGDRKVQLVGRIDRLDAVEWEGTSYLRVIDYKSGRARIDPSLIVHGLRIQLPVYLDVALSGAPQLIGAEAAPAGMLYFRVHNPFIKAETPLAQEAIEAQIRRDLKMTGLVMDDAELVRLMDRDTGPGQNSTLIPAAITKKGLLSARLPALTTARVQALRSYLRKLVQRAAQMIIDGSVGVQPAALGTYHACRYCPFRPVCRFDPLFAGNRLRRLKRYGESDAWIQMGVGEKED